MDVGGDDASGDEDGGGVEQDNIAAGAGLAGEYGAQDRGVGDGIASAQRFKRRGVQADLLRLNVAIPPATSSSTLPSNMGLLGGDLAGYPNGRRVFDDVVSIVFQAVAGAVLGLVDSSFSPDPAVAVVNQGLTSSATDLTALGTENYLSSFPYLGVPYSGYFTPAA